MRAEVLKGHLDLLLLATVAGGPAHGYALVLALRERSGGVFTPAEGTVYPALYRLERSGFLRSRWTTHDGRRRRVYALTRKGRRALAEGRKEWRWFVRAVEGVVGA
jgi:DNA-binding PadR family transcriptional regulator